MSTPPVRKPLLPLDVALTQLLGALAVRELATELLHGRLKCLRPYTPFVTCESADRATEALCAKPAQTNREKALP